MSFEDGTRFLPLHTHTFFCFFAMCEYSNSRGAAAIQKSHHRAVPPNQPMTSSLRDADMGPLHESGVKWRWGREAEQQKWAERREQQRRQRQWGWGRRGGEEGRRSYKEDARCAASGRGPGPRSTVRGVTLTAEPERSLIWHIWCGPAPTIHPFVVPPHWAAWQWSAKQQWQRGPTIRMANLLMHPRADSLTFLFTIQSGYEGKEMRKRGEKREEEKKTTKKKQMLFFLQSSCCILPTQLLRFTGCHSAVLLASVLDV